MPALTNTTLTLGGVIAISHFTQPVITLRKIKSLEHNATKSI